jgi:hypothetical protein
LLPRFRHLSISNDWKYAEKASSQIFVAAMGLRFAAAAITFCYNMSDFLWRKCAVQNNIASQN